MERFFKAKEGRFLLLRPAAFLTAFIYLFTSSVLWADVLAPSAESLNLSASISSHASIDRLTIPDDFGKIKNRYQGYRHKSFILIQNAHINEEAQHHIASLLDYLHRQHGLNQVALEGAEGELSTALYTTLPSKQSRRDIAEALLQQGRLTGSEFYAMVENPEINLFGIEENTLYEENRDAYLQALEHKDRDEQVLTGLEEILETLTRFIFSDPMREFYRERKQFAGDDSRFVRYLRYLVRAADKQGVTPENFPHIQSILKLIQIESQINFEKAKREMTAFVDKMKAGLSGEELERFLTSVTAFEVGDLKASEYYGFLERTAISLSQRTNQDNQPSRSDFQNVFLYIQYMHLYNTADIHVFDEIEKAESLLEQKLLMSAEEQKLNRLLALAATMRKMIDFSLTSRDADFYFENKESFKAEEFKSFIQPLLEKYHIDQPLPLGLAFINDDLSGIERFYALALKRDHVLTERAVTRAENTQSSLTAVVTGGFHTPGMEAYLREHGYSYAVVTPNIRKKIDRKEESRLYEQALRQTPVSIEQQLLEAFFPAKSHQLNDPRYQLEARLLADAISNLDFRTISSARRDAASALAFYALLLVHGLDWARGYGALWNRKMTGVQDTGTRAGLNALRQWNREARFYPDAEMGTLLFVFPETVSGPDGGRIAFLFHPAALSKSELRMNLPGVRKLFTSLMVGVEMAVSLMSLTRDQLSLTQTRFEVAASRAKATKPRWRLVPSEKQPHDMQRNPVYEGLLPRIAFNAESVAELPEEPSAMIDVSQLTKLPQAVVVPIIYVESPASEFFLAQKIDDYGVDSNAGRFLEAVQTDQSARIRAVNLLQHLMAGGVQGAVIEGSYPTFERIPGLGSISVDAIKPEKPLHLLKALDHGKADPGRVQTVLDYVIDGDETALAPEGGLPFYQMPVSSLISFPGESALPYLVLSGDEVFAFYQAPVNDPASIVASPNLSPDSEQLTEFLRKNPVVGIALRDHEGGEFFSESERYAGTAVDPVKPQGDIVIPVVPGPDFRAVRDFIEKLNPEDAVFGPNAKQFIESVQQDPEGAGVRATEVLQRLVYTALPQFFLIPNDGIISEGEVIRGRISGGTNISAFLNALDKANADPAQIKAITDYIQGEVPVINLSVYLLPSGVGGMSRINYGAPIYLPIPAGYTLSRLIGSRSAVVVPDDGKRWSGQAPAGFYDPASETLLMEAPPLIAPPPSSAGTAAGFVPTETSQGIVRGSRAKTSVGEGGDAVETERTIEREMLLERFKAAYLKAHGQRMPEAMVKQFQQMVDEDVEAQIRKYEQQAAAKAETPQDVPQPETPSVIETPKTAPFEAVTIDEHVQTETPDSVSLGAEPVVVDTRDEVFAGWGGDELPASQQSELRRALDAVQDQKLQTALNEALAHPEFVAAFANLFIAALEDRGIQVPTASKTQGYSMMVTDWQGIETAEDLRLVLVNLPSANAKLYIANISTEQMLSARALIQALPQDLAARIVLSAKSLENLTEDLMRAFDISEEAAVQLSGEALHTNNSRIAVSLKSAGAALLGKKSYDLLAVGDAGLRSVEVSVSLVAELAAKWQADIAQAEQTGHSA